MKKDTGSATAVGAAMLRAAHQLIDGEERLLNDPIILKMIPADWKEYVLQNRYHYYEPESMALRAHIALRSRYAEDCLAEAVKRGVKQFIILGAGLDTFAYRQPEWAKSIKIVEADHPLSQEEKIKNLQEAEIPIPTNLSFVKVDLESDNLATIFEQCTINLNEPIFMACLGVLVYLSKIGIDKVFEFAASLPKGSEFVFTISHQRDFGKLSKAAERAALFGEPWLSHFNQEELYQQLLALGFGNVIFLSPEEVIAQYYVGSKIQLPPPKRSSLVRLII